LAEKAGRCGVNVALKLAACSWPWRHVLNPQETSSKWQPSSFQNLGLATAKHHGTEGRIVPSANGCLCLTLLSERTRNYSSSLWYLVASGIVLSGFLASCAGPCFLLVLHALASCFLACPFFSNALPLLSPGVGGFFI
jgi:hypothetical protein